MAVGDKKRIAHIITGLEMGGAEMMLLKLLTRHKQKYNCQVFSLSGDGPVGTRIRALGVPVRILGLSTAFPNPLVWLRLVRWLRQDPPQLVQTWMYHADLLGGIASWLAGDLPLVWGIHNTSLDAHLTKARTRGIVRVNARLSRWLPDRIISCSDKARLLHSRLGYSGEKVVVIPNGFDLGDFKPDPTARPWLREALGLPLDCRLIGHVARFDPQKDYRTLLQAAASLQKLLQDVHFVLCGEGVVPENRALSSWIEENHLHGQVHLLGRREDIQRVMAGFDLGTLTSAYGEAFPNVIGEMMACQVPCVVTDVGDSDLMVGDTGRVVAVKDIEALAGAWCEMLLMPDMDRLRLGRNARERIRELFSLDEIALCYSDVYEALLGSGLGTEVGELEHRER